MSNCIHQRVIERKTNKQKTIYNKHQNTVDMQDYQAVTRVCMCRHVAISRKHTHRTCMETVVDRPSISTVLYYPRDAMLAWVLAISPCLSVCLSVTSRSSMERAERTELVFDVHSAAARDAGGRCERALFVCQFSVRTRRDWRRAE